METNGGLTYSEQLTKINNNRAKVELALVDALQRAGAYVMTTSKLESLIREYTDLEPELKSVVY